MIYKMAFTKDIMGKEFTKKEMGIVFSKYNLGEFTSFGKVIKDDAVSLAQIINTDKGKVFLKVFRDYGLQKIQGLKAMYELRKKKYPVFNVYKSNEGNLVENLKNKKFALFEYVNIKEHMEWVPINEKRVREYAKMLAKFHTLTKRLSLKRINSGDLENIRKVVKRFFKQRNRYSKEYKEILEYANVEIEKISCPVNQYKTGYFSEFNPGHVIFERNRVKYVIDWEIGYDYAFYDFGSSMIACFSNKGKSFSYSKLREYVKSYNKIRKLSKWELNHLYEALKFGCIKYGVWEFADIKTGGMKKQKDLDLEGIRMLKFIMNTSKEEFLKNSKSKTTPLKVSKGKNAPAGI